MCHFTIFFVLHLLAVLMYHCFWLNTVFVAFYIGVTVWNGACFYKDLHCKKYEKQLSEL